MSEVDRIKSLVREADFYRSQGLLEQAKNKYAEALNLVQKNEAIKNKTSVIDSLNKRISAVDENLHEIEKATDIPVLNEDLQKLISNLFSFSKDKDIAAVEGAIALAKFGQYEKAFIEFQRLIDERIQPLMAAENMLRCQMYFISPERVFEQFKKWTLYPSFTKNELNTLREFISKMFEKEGVKLELPAAQLTLPEDSKKEAATEPMIEISSIGIRVKDKLGREKEVEMDVTFQTGNILSFIVKADKTDLINYLAPGIKIPQIQCYSFISIFQSKGSVMDKKLIPSGPRKGDYAFDLTIEKV
jgi:tetratricopeptide (TPR) repeat protein